MFRNSETSKRLTQKTSQKLTSSQGDFLAQTSQSPKTTHKESLGKEVDFGKSNYDSLTHYDPNTASWRTSQLSMFGGLEPFSEIWPRWGMMRNGAVFPLRGSGPSTVVRESGFWPTPRASDGKRLRFKASSILKSFRRNRESGNGFSPTLPEMITVLSSGKRLKVSFVEMMMGMPTSWTDLKHSETAKHHAQHMLSESGF